MLRGGRGLIVTECKVKIYLILILLFVSYSLISLNFYLFYFPRAAAEPLGSARGAQVRNLCFKRSYIYMFLILGYTFHLYVYDAFFYMSVGLPTNIVSLKMRSMQKHTWMWKKYCVTKETAVGINETRRVEHVLIILINITFLEEITVKWVKLTWIQNAFFTDRKSSETLPGI